MAAGERAGNECSGSSRIASVQNQVCDGRMFRQKERDDGMRNIRFEYVEIWEYEALKRVRCGLEGESKSQRSEVRRIVPEEALDGHESGQFATLSNHFDHIDCRCGIAFTLHEAIAASSVLGRPYPCYALFIDAEPQSRVVYWFTYVFDLESMGVFGIWIPLTQAHGVRSIGTRSGGHGRSLSQRVGCGEAAEGSSL